MIIWFYFDDCERAKKLNDDRASEVAGNCSRNGSTNDSVSVVKSTPVRSVHSEAVAVRGVSYKGAVDGELPI